MEAGFSPADIRKAKRDRPKETDIMHRVIEGPLSENLYYKKPYY